MSIVKEVRDYSNEKVVIPEVGMVKVKLKKKQWGVAFFMNKCYIEADKYDDLLYYIADFCKLHGVIPVGEINKVEIALSKRKTRIVYRQRFMFESLLPLCRSTKKLGLHFVLSETFNVKIEGIVGVLDELKYLFNYTKKYGLNIDKYLRELCVAQFLSFLYDCGYMETESLKLKYNGQTGLLDYAPYLAVSVDELSNVDIFVPNRVMPAELYTPEINTKKILTYGYNSVTVKNLRV